MFYLLSDHLAPCAALQGCCASGASKTVNTNGEVVAELRYTAFGETWYENGQTPTELRYTGQREFGELGLYFYQSRFYDPMLGRFVQADTIGPNIFNPIEWDRYAYVKNSPIMFTDPMGHKPCDGQNIDGCDTVTSEDLKENLSLIYGWEFDGHWTVKQLDFMYMVGSFIEGGIQRVTGRYGRRWIEEHLGGTVFQHGYLPCGKGQKCNYVPGFNTVYLVGGIERAGNDGIASIIHELGHVLDNFGGGFSFFPATWVGGGPADALYQAIGENPIRIVDDTNEPTFWLRWWWIKNGEELLSVDNRWQGRQTYGNYDPADYFAETFAWTIFNPDGKVSVPIKASKWMKQFLPQ